MNSLFKLTTVRKYTLTMIGPNRERKDIHNNPTSKRFPKIIFFCAKLSTPTQTKTHKLNPPPKSGRKGNNTPHSTKIITENFKKNS